MASADRFLHLNEQLYNYLIARGHNGDPILRDLAEETRALGWISRMQIAPEQGTLMGILVRAIGAKSALEIGVFTGYSSISIARALPPDGKLLCLNVNEEWTSIARRYWERAGLTGKITLKTRAGGGNPARASRLALRSISHSSMLTRPTTELTTRKS